MVNPNQEIEGLMFKFRSACIYMSKRKPKLCDRNCFVFPQIHVSLLTENDVICIWSIVNLSQLWHLLMAKRIETNQKTYQGRCSP